MFIFLVVLGLIYVCRMEDRMEVYCPRDCYVFLLGYSFLAILLPFT